MMGSGAGGGRRPTGEDGDVGSAGGGRRPMGSCVPPYRAIGGSFFKSTVQDLSLDVVWPT
jgi:hypothetical protein